MLLAPERQLEAELVAKRLDEYPVWDEGHWSELEYTEASEYWASLSVSGRLDYIRRSRCGASPFAARRDDVPQDDSGALFEMLRA